ncbi:MAG: hypothetical protein HC837_19685 [Chloroflexaceae bacterium]|nr:hypothetical protein [Chloroflexaceae bacterium]
MTQTGTHLRHLTLVMLAVLGILFFAGHQPLAHTEPLAAPLQQTTGWSFSSTSVSIPVSNAGTQTRIDATLTHSLTETFNLASSILTTAGWDLVISPGVTVTTTPNTPVAVSFFITPPANAAVGDTATLLVQAVSTSTATTYNQDVTLTITDDATATPTATSTQTNTPTGNASVVLNVTDNAKAGTPGGTITYDIAVRNSGTADGNYSITFEQSCDEEIAGCFEVTNAPSSFDVDAGQTSSFQVSVTLPASAQDGAVARTIVRANLNGTDLFSEAILSSTVQENTPTATRTETSTPTETRTPTNTPDPSQTPTKTPGPICRDRYEDDDVQDQAREILVELSQPKTTATPGPRDGDGRRTICPSGDEDWLKFGAIEDKVYTIEIIEMAIGLDLTLELYDAEGRFITSNDDFPFDETQNPVPPDERTLRPTIFEWRAPYTGKFYIRVRDAVGAGGDTLTYVIRVRSHSYGPTPQTVSEICEDLFEPDGLPEQSRLIVSNEIQENRRLCPEGDSDWVTFFGKAGKRYAVYTNSDPYRGDQPINDVQAGADTIITLTDRDGVSIIDVNDDIPGGRTFDSEILFEPSVDGFYFVQVKNVGDIGNQFIRYDLVLELCLPGDDDEADDGQICGRDIASRGSADVPTTDNNQEATATAIAPTLIAATPTATMEEEEFSLDPTATSTSTAPADGN